MLYNLHFSPSKSPLFHKATLFGFCITHILNTGCAKIWNKKSVAKRLIYNCRSQWLRGLRRRSAAARLLSLWVQIPPDVCLLCVVRYRSPFRADQSSRGVLPTLVRRRVWSRNLMNVEALNGWGGWLLLPPPKKLGFLLKELRILKRFSESTA